MTIDGSRDGSFRETTEIVNHGRPLSKAAEAVLQLWKERFDIMAYTGSYRYIIHIWQLERYFHIEAGVRTDIGGKAYSRSVIIGDSAMSQPSFMAITEDDPYMGKPLMDLYTETLRLLKRDFGYDGKEYTYAMRSFTDRFNGGTPLLLSVDGKRCGKDGAVVYGHPEDTFGNWDSNLVAWML